MRRKGFIKILSQNLFLFKKSWISSVLLMLLEPMLYLSAFGYGVGQYINNINGQSYLDFFFVGYLCISTSVIAFLDSYQMQQSRLKEEKIYSSWLTTPLTKLDIFLGEVLWSTSKGMMGAVATCTVGLSFGVEMNYFLFPVVLFLLITAFMFSCLGSFLATLNIRSQIHKVPVFVILVAMILISGLLFPVQSLNLPIMTMSYFLPLTHAIQLSRLILDGQFNYLMIVHLSHILICSYLIFRISFKSFKEKVLN